MMNITIDGNKLELTDGFKNIVDLAKANGIGIPAPCYLSNREFGCCNGCAVKVNGELKYACVSKPEDNSNIEVNTPELIATRRNNLALYVEAIKTGRQLECSCGDCGEDSGEGCGCSDGSSSCCGS